MSDPIVYIAGDSHAEALSRVLRNDGGAWERGRVVRDQPSLPAAGVDVVVVALGTNDFDRPTLAREVRELALTRDGWPLVWVLPLHASRSDLAARRAAVVASIRSGLSGVRGVRVLDPVAVETPDGAHATRAGYERIARQVEGAYPGSGMGAALAVATALAAAWAARRWFA